MGSLSFTIPWAGVQQRSRKGKHGWYAPSAKQQQEIGMRALESRARARIAPFKGYCGVTITCHGFRGKDLDNAIKLILDSLNGVLWDDDDQVCLIVARKILEEAPRMDVEVYEL